MLRFVLALSLLTLTACAQIPEAKAPLPITDIAWRLVRLDGREIPKTQTGAESAYLRLTREGRAEGFGGCNRFFGEYRQTGGRIEFAPLAATRRACFAGAEEEDAFLKSLGSVQSWQRQDNVLRLYDAAGRLLLELEDKQA